MKPEIDETLMRVLQAHELKLQRLGEQMFTASMLIEFMLDHIVMAKDASGNPLIQIDLDKFEEYATSRQKEILDEVERLKKESLEKMTSGAESEVKLDE
jgi:hypothetical protein